jgi:fructokinase
MNQAAMYLGIDWGGTKIEIAALDDAGNEHLRRRIATPRGDYGASVKVTANLVHEAEQELGRTCTVGIGIPGSVSPTTGLIQNANSDWLIGKPLAEDLELAIGRKLRLENDANCLALSEARDGAAAGAAVVFAIILGTGCGAGLVIDGKLLTGRHRIAGEWGHNPLPASGPDESPGPPCYCGRTGCLETWISGTGFAREHTESTGRQLTAKAIVQAMREGDEAAQASYRGFLDRLGRGLASIINVIDPDIIVFGGGVSNISELYQDLPQYILPQLFCDVLTTPIVAARHGDSSGVRGAAWLWQPQ